MLNGMYGKCSEITYEWRQCYVWNNIIDSKENTRWYEDRIGNNVWKVNRELYRIEDITVPIIGKVGR